MEISQLKSIIESLILVSEEPLSISAITLLLEPDGVTKADVEVALGEIVTRYNEDQSSGLILNSVSGGYQFRTKPANGPYVQRLDIPKPSKMSQPSLETLAIVAYRQPIVRSEIEEIRGVDSGGVLKTLLEKNLIRIIGKRDEAGNPLIYGTTSKFMEMFNLNSLKDLPTLREYEELEKEHYKGTAEEQAEGEKPMLEGMVAAPFVQKWTEEDGGMINELADSMRHLRRIEKDIFPKPVETLVAVPNDPTAQATAEGGETVTDAELAEAAGEPNADTPTEDTSTSN